MKERMMALAVAMPLFEFEGDCYNALYVACIHKYQRVNPDGNTVRVVAIVITGIEGAFTNDYATFDEWENAHGRAVEAWKSALKKMYE